MKGDCCIDFVLPWVDDSDSQWQSERRKYKGEDCGFMNRNETRYRDWGILKYWFRCVEQNAPWVRKIHFITCGHHPDWLNLNHPKLNFVKHADYIPSKYLPTFSSHPIELNLHRIEGLAEQFVYFNDDVFLLAPVKPVDFFKDGLPRDCGIVVIPLVADFGLVNMNDLNIINREFNFEVQFKHNFWKWVNYRYGAKAIRNLLFMHYGNFTGSKVLHVANSFRKTTFEEVWQKYGSELDKTCMHKFRSPLDVNQWLMKYWQVVKGDFFPQSVCIGKHYYFDNTKQLERDLRSKQTKQVCFSEDDKMTDISKLKQEVINLFQQYYPDKSSFEL